MLKIVYNFYLLFAYKDKEFQTLFLEVEKKLNVLDETIQIP